MDTIDKIFNLMDIKNINANFLSKELGFKNNVVFTQWKKRDSKPNTEAIIKIAQYFNVSTDYLFGLTEIKSNFNESTITPDEIDLLNKFRQLEEDDKKTVLKNIDGLNALKNKPIFTTPQPQPQYIAIGRSGGATKVSQAELDNLLKHKSYDKDI